LNIDLSTHTIDSHSTGAYASLKSDDVTSAATLSSEYLRLAAPAKGLRFQSV
jgi:hypothetical protein